MEPFQLVTVPPLATPSSAALGPSENGLPLAAHGQHHLSGVPTNRAASGLHTSVHENGGHAQSRQWHNAANNQLPAPLVEACSAPAPAKQVLQQLEPLAGHNAAAQSMDFGAPQQLGLHSHQPLLQPHAPPDQQPPAAGALDSSGPVLHVQSQQAAGAMRSPAPVRLRAPSPARLELHAAGGADTPGAETPSHNANGDMGMAKAGRRHVAIKGKGWAGSAVWAKLGPYPWWPAQVLDDKDPYIPAGAEPPRRGAVPVRFFGTYEFSYIQSQRALAPFDDPHDDWRSKCGDADFKLGVREADDFLATGALPSGFLQQHEPTPPPQPKPRRVSKAKSKKAQGKDSQAKAAEPDDLAPPPTAQRKERILRAMALKPPPGSPFAEGLCLAGVEGLLAHQNSGQNAGPQDAPAVSATGADAAAIPGAAMSNGSMAGLPQKQNPQLAAGLMHAAPPTTLSHSLLAPQPALPGMGRLLQFGNVPLHAPAPMHSQPEQASLQFMPQGAMPMP